MSRQRDAGPRRNFLSSGRRQQTADQANGTAANSTTTTVKLERTPLLNSIGAASETLVMNKNSSGEVQTGVSWGVAAFLLVNTALGAGMLNYPYAYNQIGGVLAAALMQIVLLVFITSTMFILVYCADFNQDESYHDVLLSMCGKRAQQISALSIMLTCYGINVTFLVIIGDQYDRIFNSLLPEYLDEYWFLDRKFTIFATSVLFIWPMCYAKRLDFLKHASILGMFAMLYVAFLTVYEHYKLDEATIAAVVSKKLADESRAALGVGKTTHQPQPLAKTMTNASTLLQQNTTITNNNSIINHKQSILWFEPLAIIPVLCFAYQTHEVIVPVYACMKERFIGAFMKASIFGLVILFFLYNLVGAYGYLTFGADVGADIMSLYDAQDPIVVVGIIALVIKFITTYPPLMFCGRSALDGLYGEIRKLSPEEFKSGEKLRRYIITTLWFFSTVALAAFAPDISVTLQLLGSMASINVFVFPGMCLVSLTSRLRRARFALLIGELPDGQTHPQKAKDYYLISGSYFSAMKKQNAAANSSFKRDHPATNQHANGYSCCGGGGGGGGGAGAIRHQPQQFTATFASLIEFENNSNNHQTAAPNSSSASMFNGHGSSVGLNNSQRAYHGYGTTSQLRHQRRQEEFERLITNGSLCSSHDHHLGSSSFARPINDTLDDYSDYDDRHRHHQHKCNGQMVSLSNNTSAMYNSSILEADTSLDQDKLLMSGFVSTTDDKARLLRNNSNSHHQNYNHHILQSSWHNRSTTGSLLERFSTSIAPATVAQVGISRLTATGLYIFSAILILFGAFIFILELITVTGLFATMRLVSSWTTLNDDSNPDDDSSKFDTSEIWSIGTIIPS